MSKRILSPVLLFIPLLLLIDYYVFQGVHTLTRPLAHDIRFLLAILYWAVSIAVFSALLYLTYSFWRTKKLTSLFSSIFNIFLGILLAKIAFVLVLLTEDIYRVLVYAVSISIDAVSQPGGEVFFKERSILVSGIGSILALLILLVFVFGITRGKYYYRVRKKTLYFDDLPEKFNGFSIAQISDIHAGSFDNAKAVQRGVNLINKQKADLFVFTGDLVNNTAEEIVPWISIFKQITAPYGKYSIVGNHDYGDYISWSSREAKQKNFENLKHYHQELGFQLLLDQSRKVYKEDQYITIAGVENWGLGFAQRGDLRRALQGVDPSSFKILLSHDPSHWDKEVKTSRNKIHITLSGHTHGMQFGIEIGKFRWSPVQYRYPHWAGVAEKNGRYLYVNRGFGFLGFSGRIGIWPEITVITLRMRSQQ